MHSILIRQPQLQNVIRIPNSPRQRAKSRNPKVWKAEDLKGAPVRIESQTQHGQVVATYHDIVLGTPDAALFKPPSTCVPEDKVYQVAPPGK